LLRTSADFTSKGLQRFATAVNTFVERIRRRVCNALESGTSSYEVA
jgi:hypothetical protein